MAELFPPKANYRPYFFTNARRTDKILKKTKENLLPGSPELGRIEEQLAQLNKARNIISAVSKAQPWIITMLGVSGIISFAYGRWISGTISLVSALVLRIRGEKLFSFENIISLGSGKLGALELLHNTNAGIPKKLVDFIKVNLDIFKGINGADFSAIFGKEPEKKDQDINAKAEIAEIAARFIIAPVSAQV